MLMAVCSTRYVRGILRVLSICQAAHGEDDRQYKDAFRCKNLCPSFLYISYELCVFVLDHAIHSYPSVSVVSELSKGWPKAFFDSALCDCQA